MNTAYAVLVWVPFAFSSATQQAIGVRRELPSPPDDFGELHMIPQNGILSALITYGILYEITSPTSCLNNTTATFPRRSSFNLILEPIAGFFRAPPRERAGSVVLLKHTRLHSSCCSE